MTHTDEISDDTAADSTAADDTADDSTADDSTSAGAATADDATPRRSRRRVLTAIVVAVVVIGLAAATGFTADRYLTERSREHRDAQYVDAARQGVLNVISVSADRADRDVDRILETATGDFRADFAARSADFIDVVKKMKVTSKGTVNAVGIESSDEHEATLLVSATSLVTNGSGADEEPRVWRLRVHLRNDDDRILIEKVDFAV
ncbi:hypothetical protein [Gordonia shandongensis]|uniref:hypothetical protein n=1 Tax=Gordonia shandongensis TaxID=376351 RepID=UPI0004127A16|nr:hypothetical protein [Gordonia shandongensis]